MGRAAKALAAVALTLVSCSSQVLPVATPTTEAVVLRLLVTSSNVPLINNLTAAYTRQNPNITFEITSGTFTALVEEALNDELAYMVTDHLPSEAELPLWAAPLGYGGIAIITHPDQRVTDITTAQLRDVMQGWIDNWQALGGDDQAIIVYTREPGAGIRLELEQLILGSRRLAPNTRIAPGSEAMLSDVAQLPGALGYVSFAHVDDSVRALTIDGIAPTLENLRSSRYPLRTILYITGQREPRGIDGSAPHMRAFIAWMQSREGQAIIAQTAAPLLNPQQSPAS